MINKKDDAVSPVVGVMLMLVVVIIIAAIVSGFAGSLVGTSTKPPQANVQGKYIYSADMFQLFHAGGDELSTQSIIVKLSPNDDDFGAYSSLFSGENNQGMGLKILNKSAICNPSGSCWINAATGQSTISVFRSGETMFYNSTAGGSFRGGLSTMDPVGKSLILEVDTIDGKLVSKSKVMIDT